MLPESVRIDRRSFQSFKDELEPVLDVSDGSVERHEIVSEIVGDDRAVYHDDRAAGVVRVWNVADERAVENLVEELVESNGWADESNQCIFDKFGVIRESPDR